MIRLLSILSICLLLIFASCEDNKSSSNSTTETNADNIDKQQKEDSVRKILDSLKQARKSSSEGKIGTLNLDFPIPQEKLIPTLTQFGKENPETHIRIITRFGDIEVQLYQDTPLHRANFIMLTKDKYFDHTYFYRVAPGFVIQAGNSDNEKTREHRERIGSYLIPNEFEAGHRHSRGAFSAAKYSEQNVSKASSPFEFFIVTGEGGAHHLDNDHTVFGRVTKGMDVVDKISEVETNESEWPIDNVHIDVEIIE